MFRNREHIDGRRHYGVKYLSNYLRELGEKREIDNGRLFVLLNTNCSSLSKYLFKTNNVQPAPSVYNRSAVISKKVLNTKKIDFYNLCDEEHEIF